MKFTPQSVVKLAEGTPTSSDSRTAKSGQKDPDSPKLKFSLKG